MEIINTISNNRLFQKHGRTAAIAVAALLLILSLLSVYTNYKTQHKIKKENYKAQQIKRSNNPVRQYKVTDIVTANLFGDAVKKPVVKNAPKTTLDLTLQGILYTKESDIARAIVMVGKKKSGLYSVGEKIKGANASVKEIRDNEILLNRNGLTESLPLIKKNKSGDRQIITYEQDFGNDLGKFEDDHGYDDHGSGEDLYIEEARQYEQALQEERERNGRARQGRKPNFSGLDRALEKLDGL